MNWSCVAISPKMKQPATILPLIAVVLHLSPVQDPKIITMSVTCTRHRVLLSVYSSCLLTLTEYHSPLVFTALISHPSLCLSRTVPPLAVSSPAVSGHRRQFRLNIHPYKSRINLNQGWTRFGNSNPQLAQLNFLPGNTEGCNFFEMNFRFITTHSSSDKSSRAWCKMVYH